MATLIRLATLDDAEAIALVDIDSHIEAYRPIAGEDFLADASLAERAERWRKLLSHDPSVEEVPTDVLVAEVDGTVQAYSGMGPSRDDDGADKGEVFTLYVHPSQWRNGVGAALLHGAREHLRGMGFEDATLWVLEANTNARAFYERVGWYHDGTTKPTDTVWGTYYRYKAPD